MTLNWAQTKNSTKQKENEPKKAQTKKSTNQKQHEPKRAQTKKGTNQNECETFPTPRFDVKLNREHFGQLWTGYILKLLF